MFSKDLPLFPEQASTIAGQVDALYAFLIAVTVFFTVLVAAMVVIFSIKYRKSVNPVATQIIHNLRKAIDRVVEARQKAMTEELRFRRTM